MKRVAFIVLALTFILCSCESQREKKAIKICQETKMQINLGNPDNVEENLSDNIIFKATFALMGLDYEESTWLDFANLMAKLSPNEKFHWKAEKTDTKNVYQVGFINEEDWGHFWEVNIKEKIVRSINSQDGLARNYGHSRLDPNTPFEVKDIVIDTLKTSDEGIFYEIKGSITNETGKSLSSVDLTGRLSIIFENKTEKVDNNWRNDILQRKVSESKPWYDGEAIEFSIKTDNIKKIFLDYEPQYAFFTIEMNASDPVGYNYNKAIYEVDMKDRWNAVRKTRK